MNNSKHHHKRQYNNALKSPMSNDLTYLDVKKALVSYRNKTIMIIKDI